MTRISTEKRWAQVTIVLNDGQRFEDSARTPRGDADMPLSDQEIANKFHLLADLGLGRTRADEIQHLSGRFDSLSVSELNRLFDLCTQPIKAGEFSKTIA